MRQHIALKKLNPQIIQEIHRHKWLESEKMGYDVGSNSAATDWISTYYDVWLEEIQPKL